MKKRLGKALMGVAGLFLVIGMVCCILRPSYVKEAVGILLHNELHIEHTEESGEESSIADSEMPENSSEGSESDQSSQQAGRQEDSVNSNQSGLE